MKITLTTIFVFFLSIMTYSQDNSAIKKILAVVVNNERVYSKLAQVSSKENDTVYFVATLALQKHVEDYLEVYRSISTSKGQKYLFHQTDKFKIVLVGDLFTASLDPEPVSYFLVTNKIKVKDRMCKYAFYVTSFTKDDSLNYFKCRLNIKKESEEWQVVDVSIKDISFKKIPFL
ncbi:MAG: hypothetical protein AAF620_19150 [Bacteroidota bacterium]